MALARIKKGDIVVVTSGGSKGQTGKVLRVNARDGLVVVEKVNVVKRAVKPQGERPGGVVEKEAPVHLSNVALWDAAAGVVVHTKTVVGTDGSRVRVNVANGTTVA
jgi:large subunit ribosomal protein L24